MTISVIIATKYRHKDVLNTIKSIELQTCLPKEIIIIDQNISSDVKNAVFSLFNSLNEIKKDDIALKYIHDPQITGLTQARNRGIEENESDIVLFLDDDVILEKDFIFNTLEIYRKYPEIYGISGIMTNFKIGRVENIMRKVFELGSFADQRPFIATNPKYRNVEYVPVSILHGGLTSYRKEIFQEFKFDESFVGYGLSEDFDFSFRVSRKYKVVIAPKARLVHVDSDLGSVNERKHRESLILSKHYFFKKNLDKNIYNYLCFIWLNIGFVVDAVLLAIFRQKIDALIGNVKGVKKLIKGENSDFIQLKKKD